MTSDESPTPKARRTTLWVLLACLLLALAVRFQCAASTYMMNQDSPGYLKSAIFINEKGFSGALSDSGDPHPLYPLLIALLQRIIGDYELAALIISITFGSLAVLFIFGAARFLSEPIGWIAALLYAVHPSFVGVQSEVMTDALSHFFVSLALYGFAMWAARGRKLGLVWTAAGCMLTWAARLDGLVLTPVLLLAALLLPLVRRPRRRYAWGGPILAGIMSLAALPVVILLFTLWGKGTFTPRFPNTVGVREPGLAPAEDPTRGARPIKYDQYMAEWGDAAGSALYVTRIMGGMLFPLNAILLLVGIVAAVRRAEYRLGLVMGMVGLLLLMILTVGMVVMSYRMAPRYFAAVVIACFPLIALGGLVAAQAAGRLAKVGAPIAIMALILLNLAPRITPYRRYKHRGIREAAQWVLAHPETEDALVWLGDQRFEWYCRPRRLRGFESAEHLKRLCVEKRLYGIAVLECGYVPREIRDVLEQEDLFVEKRVFPADDQAEQHCVRVYVVRGAPRQASAP